MIGATVTIPLTQLDEMREKSRRMTEELVDARRRLDEATLGAPDGDLRRLAAAFTSALRIVQFAVATMDPLTVRGWPYRELRAIAAELKLGLRCVDPGIAECATALEHFAGIAESWENTRAEGREQERLAQENAERGVGNAISMWGPPGDAA